jgi:uncharacterized protein
MESIWDLHTHLASPLTGTPEARMAELMAGADRMGIERVVVFMGVQFQTTPTPEQFRTQNDELLSALEHWQHRAFGLAYVSPQYPEESLAEIDRLIARGPLVGIKLWVARRCSEPELDPLVTRCAELKALVFQHTWLKSTGNLPGESTPFDLATLARRHPTIPMVLGHSGGNWELGLRAVRDLPNVFVETAGFDPTAGFVEMAVREIGADRILFGSDAPGRSFASQLAKVTSATLDPVSQRAILRLNLQRLLAPRLQQLGIKP